MRRRVLSVVALTMFASPIYAQQTAKPATASTPGPSAQNKTQTKKELLNYMQQTRKEFEESVRGLSDAQLNFKAAPDKWSVKEVSEHIALAESFLGGMAAKMMSAPATDKKSPMLDKEDKIIPAMTDRSKKAQAPEPLKPTGKWATEAEILGAFNEARDTNEQFLQKNSEADLRAHVEKGPLGELDVHEFVLSIAGHTARHVKQIEEVKADPSFPKS